MEIIIDGPPSYQRTAVRSAGGLPLAARFTVGPCNTLVWLLRLSHNRTTNQAGAVDGGLAGLDQAEARVVPAA